MRLRIARKMDRGGVHRRARDAKDKRPWWTIYTEDQFRRARKRLHKRWRTSCPWYEKTGDDGKVRRVCDLTEDFFRGNRVESMQIRASHFRGKRREWRRARQ